MKLTLLLSALLCWPLISTSQEEIQVSALEYPVEILTDHWGVPHIYAESVSDLFFAQGFYAARDRAFQFEIWRRQATGTVAEVLGRRELKRDHGTRLFKFRGDMIAEMEHYHPQGVAIIESYVAGVNACIDWFMEDESRLPVEFSILNIRPQHWTPEVVISRHQGLLGNIGQELSIGRQVALLGEDKVKELQWFHPNEPKLEIMEVIDSAALFEPILELYEAYRRPVRFASEDVGRAAAEDPYAEPWQDPFWDDMNTLGSNN
ncbi:MAG: penicillin acylase family protein, partial [Saprospiraceae bacterium]|nr:penicillin acylase family protein [Saprospiraceae bacterium]